MMDIETTARIAYALGMATAAGMNAQNHLAKNRLTDSLHFIDEGMASLKHAKELLTAPAPAPKKEGK